MHKKDLVESIAKSTGLSKKDSSAALEAFLDAVVDALKKAKKVTLIGFGTFSVKQRKSRTGRNPQTGKTIKIPAKKVVKFNPGKKLKEKVNK